MAEFYLDGKDGCTLKIERFDDDIIVRVTTGTHEAEVECKLTALQELMFDVTHEGKVNGHG